MGGFGPDGYDARTVDELFEAYIEAIESEYDDELEPYQGSFNRALFLGYARALNETIEQDLEQLYDSMFVTLAEGDELTDLARQYGIRRQPAVPATGVIEWTRSATDTEQVVQKGVVVETEDGIGFETIEPVTLLGPETDTDTTDYTTTSTSFVAKVSVTFDATYRDSIDVEADFGIDNSSYTAYLNVENVTDSETVLSDNTTQSSKTATAIYDTSTLSGDTTIEFQIRTSDSSATVTLSRSEVQIPGQFGAKQNIRAQTAGTVGNVGANRITVMTNPPPNMTSVTNPWATGDPEFDLTNGDQQTLGQERENDTELKERVLEGSSIGGAATVRAVRDKIRALNGTPSLTIYTNRKLTDNANGNGLPKLSSELVIYAQSVTDDEVGQAIHEVISVTERQVNGINGTAKSYDVESENLAQTRTIKWSKPVVIDLEITLDVVESESYVGDEEVKSEIVSYVGGTLPDGSPTAGLDVSDDLIVDELERRVNGLQGVVGTASVTIDSDGDSTDDTTVRSDGLTAYEVAKNEVVEVDSADITIN